MSVVTTDPAPADVRVTRRLVVASASVLVLAVVAALLWVWLAEPAEWEAREAGVVLTEVASRGQFSVIAVFVLIGIAVSLVWGWGAGWLLSDLGWLMVPVVVVLTIVAAVVAWQLGVVLGPPAPSTVAGVSVGDRIPAQLEIDGLAPFLAWPIFGLMGAIGATLVKERVRGEA